MEKNLFSGQRLMLLGSGVQFLNKVRVFDLKRRAIASNLKLPLRGATGKADWADIGY
jgi:hypothetical protein